MLAAGRVSRVITSGPVQVRDVAVIGGGIFGVSAAIELARAGMTVALFERQTDLLGGASSINQYRLHRGYHYPRSPETAAACRSSEAAFIAEYGQAVLSDSDHYYCIAAEGSKTSPDRFLAFCDEQGLEYREVRPQIVRSSAVALALSVRERLFDPAALRRVCWQRIRELPIDVHLGVRATPDLVAEFPHTVVATYSLLNEFLEASDAVRQSYQFEVCEKPVVRLPQSFARQSVVIMDGPFMCVDPLGSTGLFVLGNVVHAIHASGVGVLPDFGDDFVDLLDRGVIAAPRLTAFPRFIAAAAEFFPGIGPAEHVGSMFTIRTVPAHKDSTDERPTLVRRHGDRLFTIFSGKIGTCVAAARAVTTEVARARSGQALVDTSASNAALAP